MSRNITSAKPSVNDIEWIKVDALFVEAVLVGSPVANSGHESAVRVNGKSGGAGRSVDDTMDAVWVEAGVQHAVGVVNKGIGTADMKSKWS